MVFVYEHSATVLLTLQLISKNEHCHTRAINTTDHGQCEENEDRQKKERIFFSLFIQKVTTWIKKNKKRNKK